MKLISNAVVYRLDLPPAANMAIHLQELPWEEMGEATLSRASFVPVGGTGELVVPIEGGFAFAMRYDEKIIPTSALNARTDEAVDKIKKEQDRRVYRKERQEIKETIHAEMARIAFIKTTVVNAFYRSEDRYLIVATSSEKMAKCLTGNLVKVVGSVKSETIHIDGLKQGLTTRLTNWLDGIENEGGTAAFRPFDVGSYVQMTGLEGGKLTVQVGDTSAAREGLIEAISAGFAVEAMALVSDSCDFKMTSDFKFKSIKFDATDATEDDELDAVGYWRHEAGVQSLIFANVISQLCTLFGYVPPIEKE